MNYKIYDKVICVVDCESIELLQLFTDKESRQVKFLQFMKCKKIVHYFV